MDKYELIENMLKVDFYTSFIFVIILQVINALLIIGMFIVPKRIEDTKKKTKFIRWLMTGVLGACILSLIPLMEAMTYHNTEFKIISFEYKYHEVKEYDKFDQIFIYNSKGESYVIDELPSDTGVYEIAVLSNRDWKVYYLFDS